MYVHVELVTPMDTVGHNLASTNDGPYVFPRLVELGARLTAQTSVESIAADGTVTFLARWQTETEQRSFATIVLAVDRVAHDELYFAAKAAGVDVRRIGDALAPRTTAAAIYEGEELGRAL